MGSIPFRLIRQMLEFLAGWILKDFIEVQGPVVRTQVSAYPGLNLTRVSFSFYKKHSLV